MAEHGDCIEAMLLWPEQVCNLLRNILHRVLCVFLLNIKKHVAGITKPVRLYCSFAKNQRRYFFFEKKVSKKNLPLELRFGKPPFETCPPKLEERRRKEGARGLI